MPKFFAPEAAAVARLHALARDVQFTRADLNLLYSPKNAGRERGRSLAPSAVGQ